MVRIKFTNMGTCERCMGKGVLFDNIFVKNYRKGAEINLYTYTIFGCRKEETLNILIQKIIYYISNFATEVTRGARVI